MESTKTSQSGSLGRKPAEVASIGGGGAEPVVFNGVPRDFDLNEGVNYILNEGSVIDLTAEVDEEMVVESAKRTKWFDLNVEPKEDERQEERERGDKGKAISEAQSERELRRKAPAQFYAAVLPPPPLPKVELPPSSATFDLGGASFFDFLSIYAFLRSFSTVLFLSPFEMDELASSVVCNESTPLFDAIHLSLMRAISQRLKLFSSEGSASASACLRSLNWDLLDSITWPIFLVEYLHKPKHISGLDLSELKHFQRDYYSMPASSKVAVLQQLCDDLVETEDFRFELSRRTETNNWKTKYFSSNGKKNGGEEEDLNVAVSDGNGDECYLCKIDGTMICCDSCPAAMHASCVGVVTSLLPEGDWHCPECRLHQESYQNLVNSIRGTQLLGTDPHGRLFYIICHYLLVVEYSCEDELSFLVYKRDDLSGVVAALEQSPSNLHEGIIRAIRMHWNLPHGVNRITPLQVHSTDSCRASSSAEARYVNLYEFAGMASSFSEDMTFFNDATRTAEEIMARQLKIIQDNKHALFSWSNIEIEKCGWCFSCKNVEDERDCLFMSNGNIRARENFTSEVCGVHTINGKKHLAEVLCHLMWIESRLQGFLQDPSQQWRTDAVEAGDVESLKKLLLQLEANLDRRAVSINWTKRMKYNAWRAIVETAQGVTQLALQVRELDANIRWCDIDNIKGSINV